MRKREGRLDGGRVSRRAALQLRAAFAGIAPQVVQLLPLLSMNGLPLVSRVGPLEAARA
jgi:hypothetical protein